MNEFYDDYEQGEAVKKWLRDNSGAMVLGVVLGLGGLFGFQYWQTSQTTKQQQAAEALTALLADDSATGAQALDSFMAENDSTSYSTMAALHLAGKALGNGEAEQAAALLERVAANGEPAVLRDVAALRLARVKLQLEQLDAAQDLVAPLLDGAFAGVAAQVQGDILLAKGDRNGARESYQKALDSAAAGDRGLLQMKLDDLTVAAADS